MARCEYCMAEESDTIVLSDGYQDSLICNLCQATIDSSREIYACIASEPFYKKMEISPKIIVEKLNSYVIGQDIAKKRIAIGVYNHLKRVLLDHDFPKNNILLLGKTGTGKTYLAETLANMLMLPIGFADATTITQAGWHGEDPETILKDLLHSCKGVEREEKKAVIAAQKGIVYLDEIDKIAQRGDGSHSTDTGIQQGLLKILEGTIADLPLDKRRENCISIDTHNILFIGGGAFEGLEEIISKRLYTTGIGFNASVQGENSLEDDIFSKVIPQDLVRYGFLPEFIGRFSILCGLDTLNVHQLREILTKPKDSLTSLYAKLFEADNRELVFTPPSLLAIAKKAYESKTGARALSRIMETVLFDFMYDVETDIHTTTITEEVVLEKLA